MEELSQTQLNHLNATFLFETQRRAIIDQHFSDLTDLRTEPHIEHQEKIHLLENGLKVLKMAF